MSDVSSAAVSLPTHQSRSHLMARFTIVYLNCILEKFSVDPGRMAMEQALAMVEGVEARLKFAEDILASKSSAEIQIADQSVIIIEEDLLILHGELFNQSIRLFDEVLLEAQVIKSSVTNILLIRDLSQFAGLDQAVAHGVAQPARALLGIGDDGCMMENFDVTAFSLGTKAPKRLVRKSHSTEYHEAGTKSDHSYHGQRWPTSELGAIEFKGLPSRPADELIIEVTFEVDAVNFLTVITEVLGTKLKKKFVAPGLYDPLRAENTLAAKKTNTEIQIPFAVTLQWPESELVESKGVAEK
ncbi:heat shock protein BiP [Diplocarpon mali]|nr:heat shock protein BiP [Diplocarpon mali]